LRAHWKEVYAGTVKRLERDLPERLSFFSFPRPLWRKLRTTNVIERCFVEVRRRTRPMVCFVNVASFDRIIYAIFNAMNEKYQWKNRTLRLFTQVGTLGQMNRSIPGYLHFASLSFSIH
jgi:transposase-like protein